MSENWYEIWADETHPVPYLLLLRPTPGGFEIIDPVQSNRVAFKSSTYEDAKLWLLEDEFVFFGRKELDEL